MKKKRRNALRFRYLNITKVILILFALFRLFSIWMNANASGIGILTLIQENLQYNLLFMLSMFDILCVLSLFHIQKQMQEGNQLERSMGMLYIMAFTQIIFMSPIVSILLLLAIYSLNEQLYFSFKVLCKHWMKKENRIPLLSTCIVCLFFTSFVYASMSIV